MLTHLIAPRDGATIMTLAQIVIYAETLVPALAIDGTSASYHYYFDIRTDQLYAYQHMLVLRVFLIIPSEDQVQLPTRVRPSLPHACDSKCPAHALARHIIIRAAGRAVCSFLRPFLLFCPSSCARRALGPLFAFYFLLGLGSRASRF